MPAERTSMRLEVVRIEVRRRRIDPRDRPSNWGDTIDGAGDDQAVPGCGLELAAAADTALEAKLLAMQAPSGGTAVRSSQTRRASIRNSSASTSPCRCCGTIYIERNPQGYCYSRFCELYRSWEGKLSVTMCQTHVGGDKLFVDYVGDTVPVIVDLLTGEAHQAQIFVAVMGASNLTFAEATWS